MVVFDVIISFKFSFCNPNTSPKNIEITEIIASIMFKISQEANIKTIIRDKTEIPAIIGTTDKNVRDE